MGRAALGKAAKSEVISVRATEAQKLELVAKYGTAAKGLQALMKAAGIGAKK
jgi:hypothetical protein